MVKEEKTESLQVPEAKRRKVRFVDPDRTTVKKEVERFDFAATPRKELGEIISLLCSPMRSDHFASVEKPKVRVAGGDSICEVNSPSTLLNLATPRKSGFFNVVLFPVEQESEHY